MGYPITNNISILRAIISFHVSSNTSDFSSAIKAIDELDAYISKCHSDISNLRQIVSGELSMLDSEIDDALNQCADM